MKQNKQLPKQKFKTISGYTYSPNDILGVGTWGTVYRATKSEPNGLQYALKKMNKYKIEASEKSIQKFQAEVQSLQKAKPIAQVIEFVDFFKSKSHYYIVTEYLQGSQDLFEYMKQNNTKFCQEEARSIWEQLLHGVRGLHQLGIYHRDIKLQNVIYLPEGKAKLIDFGVAAAYLPSSEGLVGSPIFMSPQMLMRKPYNHKCDIWSLGIVFYWMICRGSPYGQANTANSIIECMKIMKNSGVVFPENIYISESCRQVIEACLVFQQKKRMQIDEILKLKYFTRLQVKDDAISEFYEPQTAFMN